MQQKRIEWVDTARFFAMIAVMAVGIIGMVLYIGMTKGWDSFMRKEAEPATSMLKMWMNL